jgi:alpha-glucoside transport system substrate-binding protein
MRRGRLTSLAAVTAASTLALTGCLSSGDDGGGSGGGDGGDGVVTVFGAFTGAEADLFDESVKSFEEENGIDIQYTGSSDFTTLVRSRVQGNNAPDIALFPQPGLLLDLQSDLVPLDDVLDVSALEETLIPGFLDAATGDDGKVYGAPMRMAVKSIVWVPKPAFADAGYTAPTSQAELVDLSEKIAATGTPPWCIGIEAGAGTGWVATDWIEEYVLRVGGPELYDKWTSHEIPFNDPKIIEAAQKFAEIWKPDGFVLGGAQGIINSPFGEAGNPMFEDPPACWMMRQGNFITGFFPKDVQADLDANVDLFVLPPVEGGYDGQPILGGGDLAGMFSDDEETTKVMEFLSSPDFGGPWAEAGGWLSPHKTFDISQYPNETTRNMAEIVAKADVFRFDGSDLMPAQVGAGTFWTGMVEWISGAKDLETVMAEIEASWPKS